jgi:hypothetical protein
MIKTRTIIKLYILVPLVNLTSLLTKPLKCSEIFIFSLLYSFSSKVNECQISFHEEYITQKCTQELNLKLQYNYSM